MQHQIETPLEYVLEAFIRQQRSNQHEIEELKEQIKELHLENKHLEMLNQTKDDKIAELESLVYAWSSEGEAICNSDY